MDATGSASSLGRSANEESGEEVELNISVTSDDALVTRDGRLFVDNQLHMAILHDCRTQACNAHAFSNNEVSHNELSKKELLETNNLLGNININSYNIKQGNGKNVNNDSNIYNRNDSRANVAGSNIENRSHGHLESSQRRDAAGSGMATSRDVSGDFSEGWNCNPMNISVDKGDNIERNDGRDHNGNIGHYKTQNVTSKVSRSLSDFYGDQNEQQPVNKFLISDIKEISYMFVTNNDILSYFDHITADC